MYFIFNEFVEIDKLRFLKDIKMGKVIMLILFNLV